MNCQQIDELLPLYAGRDLDEKRARLVSEHIQICAVCARVADEYQEAVELTQHFAPPVFSENVYASVRRQVLQQIESEPAAPPMPQMFGSWFRPRIAWAVAGALIIAFGFFALLIVKRPEAVQPVVTNHPMVTEQPGSTATPTTTSAPSPTTAPKPVDDKHRRRNFLTRAPLVTAKAGTSSSAAPRISPKLRDPGADSLPAVEVPGTSPLRLEMQTKDPNIRIIWFTQPNPKPAFPNTKGI